MKNARKIFSGGNLSGILKNSNSFGATLPAAKMADEMGMPNSVRFLNQFDGTSRHSVDPKASRSLIVLIHLNFQMSDYYQTMGVFGMMLEDPDASTYFEKAESLQDNVQKWLWDPNTQFFYDYDLDQQVIQPVKTAAAFYALFGGIAEEKSKLPV